MISILDEEEPRFGSDSVVSSPAQEGIKVL
jgi:hypothetical protein